LRKTVFGGELSITYKKNKNVINTNLATEVNYVSIDKETGLTVEPENVEHLTNAINELLNNDKARLKYGRKVRKRVKELFDIEKNKISIF
jgi:rhamnosyl/mannosyltransferase